MTEVSHETELLRSLASELENADIKDHLKPWHEQLTVAADAWPAMCGDAPGTHTSFCETIGDSVTAVHKAVTGLGTALSAVADHYVEVETANETD